jgi:phage terminase large subunit-like protein
LRRFRTAYCAVPRKNGKSTLSAGVALYLLVADGEQGAEIYSAATTRDQARIVFDEAKRMVGSSPALKRRIQVLINNLNVEASASRFMPLSSDASSMDGLNVHGAIIDELHAHKTRHVVDVLETATGARRQPLLFEITTAGYDRHSICFEHHDYAIKLLEGTLQDDSWFAFIAAADENDDWTDPEVWRKANPSFGISVKADDLARKAEKAIALPGAQNAFRRMHLNEWTEQAERWIDMAAWDACNGPVDLERLRGRTCFGGLDLSTTTDMLSRYFVPEENLRKRAERDRVPYDLWTRQGFIEATPGNVVDYGAIEQRILADSGLFQVKEIAYDPWNATHIALRLQDEGAAMVEFRQGFRSMAAPTRELEKLIVSKKLAHGGNPVTRWMAANVAVAQDPAGNLKPAKDKSTERIDGIVAAIMAIGRHGRPGGAAARILAVLRVKGPRCRTRLANHRHAERALNLDLAERIGERRRHPAIEQLLQPIFRQADRAVGLAVLIRQRGRHPGLEQRNGTRGTRATSG